MLRPEKLGWFWSSEFGIDIYEFGEYSLFQDRNNDWVLNKNGVSVSRLIYKNDALIEILKLTRQIKIDRIVND